MRHRLAVMTVFVCVALCLTGSTSSAQFPRRGGVGQGIGSDPDYWVGLEYGYQGGMTVFDGATESEWDFGYTSQIRATFAKTIARGVAVGIAAAFSQPSLTYYPGFSGSGCDPTFGCTAKADVTQYLVFLQGGTGLGLHLVYTIDAGITQIGNFRDEFGDPLPPTSTANDFSFGLGGGAGYGINKTMDAYIAENADLVLHSQGGTVQQNAPHIFTLRLGFRAGF